jgi:hypothetical protein
VARYVPRSGESTSRRARVDAAVQAPWPYGELPIDLVDAGPTWLCPAGICVCHPNEDLHGHIIHTVFLHDQMGRRMLGARCRIHGAVHATPPDYASSDGSIAIGVHESVRSLVVEWAPPSVPLVAPFPFRRRYNIHLGASVDQGVEHRLENIGFMRQRTLEQKIRSFQLAYTLPVDGRAASVQDVLMSFHDMATLPPFVDVPDPNHSERTIRRPGPTFPPDVRPPSQGCLAAVEAVEAHNCHFSFVLYDERLGIPIANTEYVIRRGLDTTCYGRTDASGALRYEAVPQGDYMLWANRVSMTIPAIGKDEELRPLLLVPDR